MSEFISEDDLNTLDGYLRFQGIDRLTADPGVVETYEQIFKESKAKQAATPPIGLMDLERPGQHLYAVAVREESGLYLTLWVKRAQKGDVYVFVPRADRNWNPHTSYHWDGTFHCKDYDFKSLTQKRQPLTGRPFKGCENISMFAGHHPKAIGAICDPTIFTDVLEIPSGILGPRSGFVAVDLVEPGCEPLELYNPVIHTRVFKEKIPWLVIRVGKNASLAADPIAQPNELGNN
jgi:hypothetical protein